MTIYDLAQESYVMRFRVDVTRFAKVARQINRDAGRTWRLERAKGCEVKAALIDIAHMVEALLRIEGNLESNVIDVLAQEFHYPRNLADMVRLTAVRLSAHRHPPHDWAFVESKML